MPGTCRVVEHESRLVGECQVTLDRLPAEAHGRVPAHRSGVTAPTAVRASPLAAALRSCHPWPTQQLHRALQDVSWAGHSWVPGLAHTAPMALTA